MAEGTLHLFTFKTGLLSRVAHDLRLTVTRFDLEVAEAAVEVRVDPKALRVDGAMRSGALDPGSLSDADKRSISDTINDKVLRARHYPDIVFRGVDRDGRLDGTLELAGKSAPLVVPFERRAGRVTGEVVLRPSQWGIEPYKALLGAIQLQDRVIVRFDLPEP